MTTFNRAQPDLGNLEELHFQQAKSERESFFDWLEETASQNAAKNLDLSDEEVLAIIEQARNEIAAGTP